MTHDDPLQELSRALAITPSPEFAARVRQYIGTRPARWSWGGVRPLATAAVVVCVATVLMTRWGVQTGPDVIPVTSVASIASIAPVVPDVLTGVRAPAPSPAAVGAAVARPRTSSPQVVPAVTVFAETLVPDDQRLALERLLGAIRAGRATVPGVVADEIVDENGRRMPRALVIEPLTLELLAGTPAEPNKEPIKEPIK
jgi:hypothetical protein